MDAEPIHVPDPALVERTQLTAFTRFCERRTARSFPDFAAFHRFSTEQLEAFWGLFLEWSALKVEGSATPVIAGEGVETAAFFPALRLSYVESLLAAGDADAVALVSVDETGRRVALTRAELRARVARVARGLAALGVGPGDRVAAMARNTEHAVIACLAATGLGATWSSTAPDMGVEAIRGRFAPLAPKVLFAHTTQPYHGVVRPLGETIAAVLAGLPGTAHVVSLDDGPLPATDRTHHTLTSLEVGDGQIDWPRLPFNHPLFILFSSGTTGAPKCIVHGAGGTLLEHVKEHRLHGDTGPSDVLFFHTSCGWMMWNWLLSGLATGARIVVYDGSVSHPEDDALWRLVDREGVTLFGTSPVYLQYCQESGIEPGLRFGLTALRAVMSTGSILYDRQFDWVQEHVQRIPVWSISGGTDIVGCFVLGNPNLPTYRGESVCVSLGYDVRALDEAGEPQRVGRGELVCVRPFPSRPIGLYGDPDGRRFHDAYFAEHPPHWSHGDFVELTDRGTARILGRCDGILNIRGVRIGPAEIYAVLQDLPEVQAAMAVEQHDEKALGGTRLVLFVVLREDRALDRPLELQLKKLLKTRCSPFHVPAIILQVPDLPTTHSGKRSERAASDAVNGRPVRNRDALKNPESIDRMLETMRALERMRTA
jgi:acetoacetyl-CoA synthetase